MNDTTAVREKHRSKRIRSVNIGRRQVLIHGLASNVRTDVYHLAMTVGWPSFLAGLAAVFCLVNAVFALAYWISPGCVANADDLLKLFFFSVETLTTVGYGEYSPVTTYAHIVVSIETFTGLFFTASMLGLIFARVSRPRARMIFARNPVIGPHDGEPMLVVRVANERLNLIATARARVWLSVQDVTAEQVQFRRFLELELVRSENPMFALSWTIMHRIEASSPLHGLGAAELGARDAFFIVAIVGHDQTSAQDVHAQQVYTAGDIRWGHRFADMIESTESGLSMLNYGRFHTLEPVDGWVMPAADADPVSSPQPGAPIASGGTRPLRPSAGSGNRP